MVTQAKNVSIVIDSHSYIVAIKNFENRREQGSSQERFDFGAVYIDSHRASAQDRKSEYFEELVWFQVNGSGDRNQIYDWIDPDTAETIGLALITAAKVARGELDPKYMKEGSNYS